MLLAILQPRHRQESFKWSNNGNHPQKVNISNGKTCPHRHLKAEWQTQTQSCFKVRESAPNVARRPPETLLLSFLQASQGSRSVTAVTGLQSHDSRPMSPFDSIEAPEAIPTPGSPLAENAPLQPRKRSARADELIPEKTIDTGLIARIDSRGEVQVHFLIYSSAF